MIWSHEEFVKRFNASPYMAFKYRKETLGVDIPEEYRQQELEDKRKILEETDNINVEEEIDVQPILPKKRK